MYVCKCINIFSPSAQLPCGKQAAIAVRFSNVLYHTNTTNNDNDNNNDRMLSNLPYEMVFAVATINEVIVYHTSQTKPIALLRDLHITEITDITWYTHTHTSLHTHLYTHTSLYAYTHISIPTGRTMEKH